MIDPKVLVDCYAASVSDFLVKHHLDSYNQYVSDRIGTIIRQFNPYRIRTADNAFDVEVFVGGEGGSQLAFHVPVVVDEKDGTRPMRPKDARDMSRSYVFDLRATVLVRVTSASDGSVVETSIPDVHVMSAPIMLRSDLCHLRGADPSAMLRAGECPYDLGGYFIVDGKEKVIITQEKIREHQLFTLGKVDDAPGDGAAAKEWHRFTIRCTSEEDRLFPKEHAFAVFKSTHKTRANAILVGATNIRRGDKQDQLPVFYLFRALGVETDRDIIQLIYPDGSFDHDTGEMDFSRIPNSSRVQEYLRACVKDGGGVRTQEQAIQVLSQYNVLGTKEQAMLRLVQDFMPHAGRDLCCKALVLADLVRTVIAHCIAGDSVDRDSMVNKRLDVSGFLLTYITRDFVNRWRLQAMYSITQEYMYGAWKGKGDISQLVTPDNVASIFSPTYIDKRIIENFKTNKRWAIRKNPDEQESIVQDLKRVASMSTLSHLRRVNTPVDRTIKMSGPHLQHSTHWGIMCPTETPDGPNIGLLKHLAMLAYVTFDLGNDSAFDILTRECGMVPLRTVWQQRRVHRVSDRFKVCFNNVWVGAIPEADALPVARYLRLRRRCGQLAPMTSVALDVVRRTLNIGTERGRCARPVLVVDEGRLLWRDKTEADVREYAADWWKCVHPDGVAGMSFTKDESHVQFKYGPGAFRDDKVLRKLTAASCPVEFLDVEEAGSCLVALHPSSVTPRTTHCEIHPMTILGWNTANQPCINHIPAPRALNATGNTKQAVGLYSSAFRRRWDTEGYVLCYPQAPIVTTSVAKYVRQLNLPPATNLIVAVMPFTGYNQEDSLIVNRSAVERGALMVTAMHSITAMEDASARFYDPTQGGDSDIATALDSSMDYSGVDASGAIAPETRVRDRTVLFAMRNPKTGRDVSISADKTIGGRIDRVKHVVDPETGFKKCTVVVRETRQFVVGDKLSLRFYQKGTCGLLIDQSDMPFTEDGIVPDIIMNTHAIPSRMTAGQFIETVLATDACRSGLAVEIEPFDDSVAARAEGLQECVMCEMKCAVTGEVYREPCLMGVICVQRQKQMVIDKINYRSYGPVDALTGQPLRGRDTEGGLKLGNMELGALLAHGVSSFTHEAFGRKSDAQLVSYDLDTGAFPDRDAPNSHSSRSVVAPRAFAVMGHELSGMAVGMTIET